MTVMPTAMAPATARQPVVPATVPGAAAGRIGRIVVLLFLVPNLHFQPCMPLSLPSSSTRTATSLTTSPSTATTTALFLDKVEASPHERIKITSSIAKSERRANERLSANYARELCRGCKRPTSICLCESLPPNQQTIDTTTQILILQHPTEFKRKTISTVPLIPLILSNCQIKIGYQFKEEDVLGIDWVKQALDRDEKPLLLFPGPDALDLNDFFEPNDSNNVASIPSPSSSTSSSSPTKLSRLLILIDGTWTQAKRTARESPFLASCCQKVQFTTKGNSIYDAIRREPQDHFVSTLECCAQALCLLEPQFHANDDDNNDRDHHSPFKNNQNSTMAAHYMIQALSSLVNQQLEIRSLPGSKPRFVKPTDRFQEKHEQRRLEIEWELFQSRTEDNPSLQQQKRVELPPPLPKRIQRLLDGSVLRPLRHSDAPLINSVIPRCQTTQSLQHIIRQIGHHQHPANIGIFRGHELCGCILQYENGVLGMLQVLPEYENRGYGSLLVKMATELLEQHQEDCACYILDGNAISEHVFAKHGWEKADPNGKKRTGRRRAPRLWIKKRVEKYTHVVHGDDDESKEGCR